MWLSRLIVLGFGDFRCHRLRRSRSTFAIQRSTSRCPYGRGCGVGRSLRGGMGLGVGVGRIVAVGVGVTVGVGVMVGVGVGDASDWAGAWISTKMGGPVLKKVMPAVLKAGGAVESNRKLYSVPKRIAFAFGFCARVSVLHVAEYGTF